MKRFISRILQALPIIAVLVLVWCIWSESFSLQRIIEGTVLGTLALILTNRMFLRRSYERQYRISVITLIRYVLVLIVEIFRSGLHAIYITVTDRINVGVVDLPTKIHDPMLGTLVATAITLTPGTVTIDYSPGRFKVVWIECSTTDAEEAGEMIKGSFERVLLPSSHTDHQEDTR